MFGLKKFCVDIATTKTESILSLSRDSPSLFPSPAPEPPLFCRTRAIAAPEPMTEAAPSNGHAEATARKANKVDDDQFDNTLPAPSTSSSSSSLPVIDINPLLSSSSSSSPLSPQALEAAEAIAAACLKSRGEKALGFFYAVGHGIPEEALDAAHAAAAALWGSPAEVRSALDARRSPLARGYLGLGALEHTCTRAELATLARERLGEGGEKGKEKEAEEEKEKAKATKEKKAAAAGDLKQSFAFGCEREEGDPRTLSPMHGPNQWPGAAEIELVPALRGFRAAAEDFRRLGLEAARAVARGLSLALTTNDESGEENEKKNQSGDPSMFESALSKPAALTVMLRYPPLPERDEDDDGKREERNGAAAAATSCGTHTDCGFLTLIDQRGLPGLEVFGNNGEWIPVPPLRVRGQSALVVNLGDLAEYWSGGRVASTLHRVEVRRRRRKKEGGGNEGAAAAADTNTAAADDTEEPRVRDSLIVFSNANFDAPVVPPGGEGKPTTAGAYIFEKLGIMWNGGEEEKDKEKEKS